ncbi:MAG: hypothetical protein O3C40_29705 [Planctomycetota bacterium]|nr:hypothetical protein [Planctomycetota bacterium]
MIPDFDESGNLPPGVHEADWEQIVQRFGWTSRRRELLDGLKTAMEPLREAGCRRVFVNGSFVTEKDDPGDIDVAWDPIGVDVDRLLEVEPVFGDFTDGRAAQKKTFGCEFFPSSFAADLVGSTFLEFFQIDKETEAQKGIVALDLEGES